MTQSKQLRKPCDPRNICPLCKRNRGIPVELGCFQCNEAIRAARQEDATRKGEATGQKAPRQKTGIYMSQKDRRRAKLGI